MKKQTFHRSRTLAALICLWTGGLAVSAAVETQAKEEVSISGKVVAMDGSPQIAIVIEALRVVDTAASLTSTAMVPESLLPKPEFSQTTLTDTNGVFRFINLWPGRYRLRGHDAESFIFPEGDEGTDSSGALVDVEAGKPRDGIRFVVPRIKKGVWKNYPVIQGLSEVQPTSIHRTPDGMIWVGTHQSFLYAFDGLDFKMMASAPEIAANEIGLLEYAADGALWIGSTGGVNRHAGGSTPSLSFGEPNVRHRVDDILADPDGTVWLATSSGLFRYNGREFIAVPSDNGITQERIISVIRTRDGALWMTTERGLIRFDGTEFSLVQSFEVLGIKGAKRLHEAKDGAIWFAGDEGGGVYRYDGNVIARIGAADGLLSDVVHEIAEGSDGVFWFGTAAGLSRFNGTTIVNYTVADGLSNDWIRDIHVDTDDVVWCANGWGVSRFDPKGFVRFTQGDGLLLDHGGPVEVFTTEAEADGSVLIGTGWRGVFRGAGTKLEAKPSMLEGAYVRRIHRAKDGTVWVGTSSGIFKEQGGEMIRVLERKWIIALCSDAEGNLWYGCGWSGGGLGRFNPETGEDTVFGVREGLPDDQVWAIESAEGGGVWVGTNGGLARYRNGKIEAFGDRFGIPTGGVFDLRRDADDVLWIGSRLGLHLLRDRKSQMGIDEPEDTIDKLATSMGAGSAEFVFDSFSRISITATNGLPDQHVWSSARTSDGKIWMGTDRYGLLGYDGKAVTVIDKRDGLLGSIVITISRAADDALWLGFHDGGVVRYQPSKARPSIRFQGVRVDGQTVTNFAKTPNIMTGRRVTFQYQAIDQKTHPEKRQFWYRLVNHSGETLIAAVTKDRHFDWVPQRRGSYTFEVQAIDRDLNYSEPARLMMRVAVPWHANAWILTPMVGAFGGLVVWAFFARTLYLRKSRETVLLRERVRIARDLHDHLGAGLTHVAMLGDMVGQQASQQGAVEMLAGRLTETARELTRTMGEVIWATDPDKDTLQSFALFVTSYAERFFGESALRLRYDIPSEIPAMMLPAEFRSSLLTVMKEALNNVAKHAQATELRIKMDVRDHDLFLSFEDNGQGFALHEVASERRGLLNMKKRLRDLGGELRIESVAGRGTRVHTRLPLPKK